MINECFTGKMNLPNFHIPSLQEHIPECYKSTHFMHNWILHELAHCTCVYGLCTNILHSYTESDAWKNFYSIVVITKVFFVFFVQN